MSRAVELARKLWPGRNRAIRIIEQSGLFDAAYYTAEYGAFGDGGRGPIGDFLTAGAAAGRKPNPYFDPAWYLQNNPDVRRGGIDPLLHYLKHGDREGRAPGPWFSPAWYRARYAVPDHGTTALAHYLGTGRARRYNPNPWFDVAYYLAHTPEVAERGLDPVIHFHTVGFREGRNPSPDFDLAFYRERYLPGDHATNPLLHYLSAGSRLGYLPRPGAGPPPDIAGAVKHFTNPGPGHEPHDPGIAAGRARRARLFAFYLPQFHAIPQNDAAWGKGFTEWRNVARALPRFAGHYQPRQPGELGYYDLTGPGVMQAQIALAKASGLAGFCFYHYWFNGRRVMNRPVDAFLADPSLDIEFCVIWANENWTRRWDGHDEDVVLRQDYDPADEAALIADFARHFADRRYIRLGGRPLFLLYRPGLIPDAREAIARWRRLWRQKFDCDPLIFMAQSFGDEDPAVFGLDGAVEFPPHKLAHGLAAVNGDHAALDPNYEGIIRRYEDLPARARAAAATAFPLIRTVCPGWDNEARHPGRGITYHGATPRLYERWLDETIGFARAHPVFGERLVFINAWNEWAEAAYLEPDIYWGAAYLNATARAAVGKDGDPRD